VKVYVAGPLFNDMERSRNLEVERWLRARGWDVHLPQKQVLLSRPARGGAARSIRRKTFAGDVAALRGCDAVLCLLDGAVPDDGMCVELGIAWALGKPCVGYRTDMRRHGPTGPINPMIEGCLLGVARTRAAVAALLSEAEARSRGGRTRRRARRTKPAAGRRRSAPRRR
jgi:nucleoside 2-deoxyribosyltransferase